MQSDFLLQNYELESADVSEKTTCILYSFLPANVQCSEINKYITCLDAESLGIRFKVLKNEWLCEYVGACVSVNIDWGWYWNYLSEIMVVH